ncbi:CLUMA_CG010283, isoform A [Clunio marinus]|uniref:CLUMA_CG010283, isoform A n=1 Tax=Clunio marinus TaxID=568069 RepID=A0A1J1I8D8_9DIPT|nr:CLUMA_CG010283, isoform A [Clunio marinus]
MCNISNSKACSLSLESGSLPCPVSQKRYYYNTVIGSCESFRYVGCNDEVPKNFDDEPSCRSSCLRGSVADSRCTDPAFTGSCRQGSSSTRWYYDDGEYFYTR